MNISLKIEDKNIDVNVTDTVDIDLDKMTVDDFFVATKKCKEFIQNLFNEHTTPHFTNQPLYADCHDGWIGEYPDGGLDDILVRLNDIIEEWKSQISSTSISVVNGMVPPSTNIFVENEIIKIERLRNDVAGEKIISISRYVFHDDKPLQPALLYQVGFSLSKPRRINSRIKHSRWHKIVQNEQLQELLTRIFKWIGEEDLIKYAKEEKEFYE